MRTDRRDDAIAKNKQTVRLLKIVCLAQSAAIVALAALVLYFCTSKEIVYQPTMGSSYTMSERHFSPAYLRNMATDIMQLRLTWNAQTVTGHYAKILTMVKPNVTTAVRKMLNSEIAAIKKRNISSVFYQTKALVDVKNQVAKVSGNLVRTDDGVVLPSVRRTYLIQFHYTHGTLQIVSIADQEKQHA